MASLISKASLLMVPSVYEDGTLYNVLPSGNKAPDETGNANGYDQTRADFSFTRGANLSATRIGSDGLIEKGRENLLTYSNTFSDSDWEKSDVTITSGFEGYDGTNNAWELTRTATAYARMNQAVTQSGVYTHSIYAKAGTLNWISIGPSGGGEGTWFNLSNGTIGVEGSLIKHSSIESIGNGWYRISVVVNNPINQWFRFYPSDVDGGDQSTTATGTIYVQNAQLEYGLAASSYLDSGATTATAGVLENTPRIDYSSGAGALLLEPQSTNSVANSEYHSGTTYGNNYVTTTDNEAISPEGLQNAAKIVLDSGTNTSNGGHYYSLNSTAGTTYTISVFAKAGEYRYFTFTYGSSTAVGGHFDLQEGVKLGDITNSSYTNTSTSIEDYGNGWYRLIVTLTDTNGAPARFLSMKPSPSASVPSNNNYSSTGDGTSGAYIYGFQLEASASYPSSYVPTYGSAATRGADSCSVTGVSDVIGQTEGTLFVEFEYSNNSVGVVSIHSGNIGNRVYIGTDSNGLISQVRVGYVQQAFFSTPLTIGTTYKCAIAYKANDFALYVNGSQIGTDTSGSVPSSMIKFGFESGAGGDVLNQPTKQTILFDTRLTNSELATLTTL